MCGLVGFLEKTFTNGGKSVILSKMVAQIRHRGPNDTGVWLNSKEGINLAHARLSIIDLSPAGHQPMESSSGRYAVIFNGEIYNHLEIREDLNKRHNILEWRGGADTETLLAGFDYWGVEETLKRCTGMFSLATWDQQEKTLILARDRIGEKPLYYGWQGDTFLFGSELKALKVHPAFKAEINRDSICLYMRHNCIPAPHSIYKGIYKISPGTFLTVSLSSPEPIIKSYWSAVDIALKGINTPFSGSPEEAIDELEVLLKGAVAKQMMADVPLGAFLSGGVDSSVIVALMQAQSKKPIKTFSIGFNESLYNEAEHAKAVAQYLKTDHTELYVSPSDSMAVIPNLPTIYDEPFSDSSQIPTFLVSQLARKHVTVSLSGDAGDELFTGYNRYMLTANTWSKLSQIPRPIRNLIAKMITILSPTSWNRIANILVKIHPLFSQWVNVGDKLHKGAGVMGARDVEGLYRGLVTHWPQPENIVLSGKEPLTLLTGNRPNFEGLNNIERMMLLDLLTYLPDDILCKVDRAAMAVSLETRVPFLDHHVVEFSWKLPLKYKIREGQSKWILRQVLYRHVPKKLIERPKMGFGVPIGDWLRSPLRDWAEDLLDESRLCQDGYFHPSPIRKKWQEHLSGRRNWQHHLWDVLMFNAWLDKNR